ncbi:RNA polymerase sigma factor [Achromobacter insuavis]|uniref:ECF subfamily RNA polymerase sigma factor n=1 Tax=Achromobacter insuavis AXX-A TaxID=1003200 RepID=F7SXU3_9BURK|nr:RNA polymerase sigma factor [Achromobacter insuavis]EGP47113.1 ECF subfamily RNA polymerase sigma factor [Achromobacter insuavis AXX-A]
MAPQPDVARLYAAYAERLRRYLFLKTGEAELSADLVQECFARLVAQEDELPSDNALAYLYAIANRLLIDHRRNHHQARTEVASDELLQSVRDLRTAPDVHVHVRRQLARLAATLAELPLRTRQIFQLCRVEGLSYQDAARYLDISPSSVQKHLAMALELMRERLGDDP